MIARLGLMLLLCQGAIALAQPLYKWKEADGSITFSPQPPTHGVAYERLESGGSNSITGNAATADNVNSAAATGTSLPAPVQAATVQPAALPPVRYAPGNDRDLPNALSRPDATSSPPTTLTATGTALAVDRSSVEAPGAAADVSASISAASFKRSRCEDLRKRVTSLEQRLRQPLSPEDMDNTVIHMARYQRSHDQYCVQ